MVEVIMYPENNPERTANELFNEFRLAFRAEREMKKMSIEELASTAQVDKRTIKNFEQGKNRPRLDIVLILCVTLGHDMTTLFFRRPDAHWW